MARQATPGKWVSTEPRNAPDDLPWTTNPTSEKWTIDSSASQMKYLTRPRRETQGFILGEHSPDGDRQQETGVRVGPEDGVVVQAFGSETP